MKQIDRQLAYLYRLERFEKIKPGLRTMNSLLARLNNPHSPYPSIHLSGTNGKGSTAAFLNNILNHTNLKIGLYTSPHLRRFNERIVINNQPISDKSLSDLIIAVKQVSDSAGLAPTYFEFTTALAFLYFAQKKVDLAVIEVGMGGRLDATNVINPVLSIITNIGLDHAPWLGKTKMAIAKNKAGIIKNKVPLITAEEDPRIIAFFKKQCLTQQSPIHILKEHLSIIPLAHSTTGQSFRAEGIINDHFSISLLGAHQLNNAATAILAATVLKQTQTKLKQFITLPAIKAGLKSTRWPGRCDIVSKKPFVLIDGAHNEPGVNALSKMLDSYELPSPDILLLGVKNDKDPKPFLNKIVPRFNKIIVTEAKHNPAPAAKLARLMNLPPGRVQVIPDLKRALARAKKELLPHGMLLITGSLYLAGDAITALKSSKKNLPTKGK